MLFKIIASIAALSGLIVTNYTIYKTFNKKCDCNCAEMLNVYMGLYASPETVDIKAIWNIYEKIPNLRYKVENILYDSRKTNIKQEYIVALVTYNLPSFWDLFKFVRPEMLGDIHDVLLDIYSNDTNPRWDDKNDVKHRILEVAALIEEPEFARFKFV